MLILSYLLMMDPQLKLLPKIAMVYAKGIHAYEHFEQYFSPYKR
jgi:hypothetical protein